MCHANNPSSSNDRITFKSAISKDQEKLITAGCHVSLEEKIKEGLPDAPEDPTLTWELFSNFLLCFSELVSSPIIGQIECVCVSVI